MNLLQPSLKYTDAQTKKQTSLPIEQLTDGAVAVSYTHLTLPTKA